MPCHVHAPFQVLGIGRLGFDVVPISLLYAVWDTVVPISLCMLFGAMLVDMVKVTMVYSRASDWRRVMLICMLSDVYRHCISIY